MCVQSILNLTEKIIKLQLFFFPY